MNFLQLRAEALKRLKLDMRGYGLQITGDVDAPNEMNLELLNEWIQLAKELSTKPPILYVTFIEGCERVTKIANDNRVTVGFHGYRHVAHSHLPDDEIRGSFEKATANFPFTYNRYPFLGGSNRLLKLASDFFQYDSSTTSNFRRPYKPFILNGLVELPIQTPSDTWFKYKGISNAEEAAQIYRAKIRECEAREVFCTLLLHPNKFSVEVMRSLVK